MLIVKPRYVVNEQREPVAVQIDVSTWEKIEEMLEDRLLVDHMRESEKEPPLLREQAMKYYAKLKKT